MPYPDRAQIYEIFQNLRHPPDGAARFFHHVSDNVHFHVTGKHRLSGTWDSKQDYLNATWANISKLLAPPGPILEICGGEAGVIVGQGGWTAVELKTVETKTLGGVVYDQHYAWHCRFDEDGKIGEIRAFLDGDHLEKVLGGEQARQAALSKDSS